MAFGPWAMILLRLRCLQNCRTVLRFVHPSSVAKRNIRNSFRVNRNINVIAGSSHRNSWQSIWCNNSIKWSNVNGCESTASICSTTSMPDLTTAVLVRALIAVAPVGRECFKSHVDVSTIPAATVSISSLSCLLVDISWYLSNFSKLHH